MKQYDNLIIDSMNMAYRVYFKMPVLTNTEGENTSSIYGFVRLLNSTFNRFQPSNVILTWDSKNNKRKKIDSDYKIKRFKEPDENLFNFIKQIVTLRTTLQEIGIPTFYKDGYESDDLIAIAICKYPKVSASNYPIDYRHLIYSSDNDLYQLLDDNVDIFNGTEILTKAEFIKRFGFEPRMYAIYKAMTGCSSDNVKGIPGIGEKRALTILKECNYDVEEIYTKIDKLGYTKDFNKALRLVTLPLDLDYLHDDEQINNKYYTKIDEQRLLDFLYRYNINTISVKDFLRRENVDTRRT